MIKVTSGINKDEKKKESICNNDSSGEEVKHSMEARFYHPLCGFDK